MGLLYGQETAKTTKQQTRSSTSSSGGKSSVPADKVAMEVIAGGLSLVLAGVSSTGFIPRETQILDAVICGMAGFFGAYAFLDSKINSSRAKIIAILIGGGFASIFGPLAANALGYYFPWVGTVTYFVEAAVGAMIGLLCTPMLGMLRDPGTAVSFLLSHLPFMKKSK